MTDAQILAIAYGFEQYPGAKEPTLRGQAIVDFARALMADLKNGPHYSPPGTTSSAAAPKESA